MDTQTVGPGEKESICAKIESPEAFLLFFEGGVAGRSKAEGKDLQRLKKSPLVFPPVSRNR